ncbi:MAG: UDP-2,3-diacetamido-2,3-dideoxy-D-glucuronate 2-epimerase [Myxococcota bacterium]|nr:UDP-2,3-diacetamido-2,3-dideoxy-D-glucuronate 2-epimerase [Myxococcota bacterium]
MTHVVSIVGARPQFIKAAVVSRALAAAGVRETLVHTGQHYDAAMSDVFFQELGLPPPAHHLGAGGLGHGAATGRMLEKIEAVLLETRPDWVLVYGDTNSTIAGALAAVKLHIPVAHVEAGMRSFNRRMPEEINRVLTDHAASLQLLTHEHPRKLLADEGITTGVHTVGDTMYDAALLFRPAAERSGARRRLGLEDGGYALATLHRAENTDDPARLRGIITGLTAVGAMIPVLLPLHPRTRKMLGELGLAFDPLRVRVIDPIGYLDMLDLERGARLILTDSGGVQKEALFNGVPCITMRDETEWVETVELGWNILVGADAVRIEAAARRFLSHPPKEAPPPVYGDGRAGEKIAMLLRDLAGKVHI